MNTQLRGMRIVRSIAKSPAIARNPLVGYAYRKRIAGRIRNRHPFPPGLLVETVNACNARCVMCPYSTMTRPKGTMSWELYTKIVDEAAQHPVKRFQLNATNEPLLDPLIFRRIRYAKDKGIQGTRFFSNASLLDEGKAKKLLESGLDLMTISLDGASKEAYEQVRINLNFDTVTRNIARFLDMRKAGGFERPKVELHMTVSRGNEQDAKAFVKKYRGLADIVTTTVAHDWAGQTQENNPLYNENRAVPQTPCRRLWFDFNVLWDGRVALCCLDYDGKVILGDVRKQSIADIWNGEAYGKVRTLHEAGQQEKADLCNTCHERVSWWRGDGQ